MSSRAIIVGAGLGGLSAAIHLRLQGREVIVLEANARTGGRAGRIERDGFLFDTGPSLLNYPWVFEELFAAAGRNLYDYLELIPVNPSVEFRWPDGTRFALSSNVQQLRAECERVEPGSGPGLMAFLKDAAAKYDVAFGKLVTRNEDSARKWLAKLTIREAIGTGVWHSLDAELRRFFPGRYIREAFGSYGMYLGGSPFQLPGLFSILAYGELAYGLWLPRGGIYALVEAMTRLAAELGVEIHTGVKVRSIDRAGSSVRGVTLEDGTHLNSFLVVSNVDVPTTDRTLLRSRAPAQCRMTPGVLTFYWGVRGAFEAAGHHTIFLPGKYRATFDQLFKEGRVPDEIPFYVSIPSATDASLAPKGDTTIFVLVPTPLLSQAPQIDVQGLRRRILERLGLPEERIITEEVWTPEEWKTRFGLHDGSAFGASHSLFQMGPFRARNYSRRTEGLFYVGASTTPGTGMPMVVLGGKMVAERVASHAR